MRIVYQQQIIGIQLPYNAQLIVGPHTLLSHNWVSNNANSVNYHAKHVPSITMYVLHVTVESSYTMNNVLINVHQDIITVTITLVFNAHLYAQHVQ